MDIKKVYNTIKYMTARQWKYRLYYMIRNKILRRKPKKIKSVVNLKRLSMNYGSDFVVADLSIADGLLLNRIPTISERVECFKKEIDWNMNGENYRLVCFRLNSFRYLLDLSNAYKQAGNIRYVDKGFELIDDWIKKNSNLIVEDKWNPYVIADRLMNWIGFISEYCDNDKLEYYSTSIYSQAIELSNSIEYQLGANHLLSEGRALMACGVFLSNEKLYKYGKKILTDEYSQQFLEDGGHYERSISYHVESLQQYYEAIWLMNYVNDADANKFAAMIKPSYIFLNGMVSVNGRIPLFNDSAIDYPFYDANDFLDTSKYLYKSKAPKSVCGNYSKSWELNNFDKQSIDWQISNKNLETGIVHYQFSYKNNQYSFFFDVGDNGPDSNLGHAHADALSLLFSDEKNDIFVDSGVFTYQPGEMRNECRSTNAHNTIEIDDKNNTEVWSAFRVARRGHKKIDKYEEDNDGLCVKASYDGYKKILKNPVIHTRELTIDKADGCFRVCDHLECDESHKAVLRFHIGAQCKIKVQDEHECMINDKYKVYISEPIKIKKCKIASRFGILEDAYCIESEFLTKDKKDIKTIVNF